jgi:hypothetical protein
MLHREVSSASARLEPKPGCLAEEILGDPVRVQEVVDVRQEVVQVRLG